MTSPPVTITSCLFGQLHYETHCTYPVVSWRAYQHLFQCRHDRFQAEKTTIIPFRCHQIHQRNKKENLKTYLTQSHQLKTQIIIQIPVFDFFVVVFIQLRTLNKIDKDDVMQAHLNRIEKEYISSLKMCFTFNTYGLFGNHGLRTPREEIAFTTRPNSHSNSQILRYG